MSKILDHVLNLLMAAGFFLFAAAAVIGAIAMTLTPARSHLPDVISFATYGWLFFTAAKMGEGKE